jgi:hypothetical protein
MVLRILSTNHWKKPIYFAVTVARSNMLSELQDYMRMDGLAYKVVPFKNWSISPDRLERNLVDIYKYRGLQDSTVYYDKNIIGLIQNYRTAFLQLAEYYARDDAMDKVKYLMAKMDEKIPSDVIPWSNRYLRLIRDSYTVAFDSTELDSIMSEGLSERDMMVIADNLYRMNRFSVSAMICETLVQNNPDNVQALSLLIGCLDRTREYNKGVRYLESWLERNPRDTEAKRRLDEFKAKS